MKNNHSQYVWPRWCIVDNRGLYYMHDATFTNEIGRAVTGSLLFIEQYAAYLRTCIADATISIRKLPKGVGL